MSADGTAATGYERDHRDLARHNQLRLRPGCIDDDWSSALCDDFEMRMLEGRLVEEQRRALASLLEDVPDEADAFMHWFEQLRERGPGQRDALFPWLAQQADLAAMRWFITQEMAGEAGFDDLVALTQVRMPVQAKLELARNYWDEMGRGHEDGMHGPMLAELGRALGLQPSIEGTVWESLALANLMVALAANRRYAYHSIGALGVIEMTAPGRVAQVNEGLRRLGLGGRERRYFQLHAGLDLKHSADWNREVIRPLVEHDPALARPIAEGALLRLAAGARCFERYRRELGVQPRASAPRYSSQPQLRNRAWSPPSSLLPMSLR
ncbi:MAG TPA: iron-containing redox enzyme family protein [Nevskiaceae bacterium]|nr:iron-containing redox enzyme family protein [Nevskiaceae bacterium]